MDREAFLQKVRVATGRGGRTDPGLEPGLSSSFDTGDLEARFMANLASVGGTVHECADQDIATEAVATLLRSAGGPPFLSWDAPHLPIPGLLDDLAANGLERRIDVVPDDPDGRRAHQLGYYDCTAGLTGADAALAESGSIVVASGRGRSRMASLIPEIHIALLDRSLLWPSLRAWIDAHPRVPAAAANWTVITGPSRTADIEQVLTRGVHGPREVHVVLI